VPTGVATTRAGSNGSALNAGPVVRYNVPVYVAGAERFVVADSHSGVPSVS
jgi:hypothetical protein